MYRLPRRCNKTAAGVNWLAAQPGLFDVNLPDVVHRAGEDVAVQNDEVGQVAFFERAFFFFFEGQPGIVRGVEANRLLARDALLRMKRPIRPAGLAGERYPYAQERTIRIDR